MNAARFAAHAHSDWSYDGRFSLPAVARLLAALGYRGVLMSEHDRGFDEDRWAAYREACASASTPTFLVVPGIEYSSPDNVIHIPVWGDLPFLGEELETTALLQTVGELGGAAVFAHPSRLAAWQRFAPEWSRHLLGVEVWNVKQDGYAPSADGIELWRRYPALMPLADLDFHTVRHLFPLALEIGVPDRLTVRSVHTALRNQELRGLAFRSPVQSFTQGRPRQRAIAAERSRTWAFRRVKRVVKGHY
jgi:hypothetical protein